MKDLKLIYRVENDEKEGPYTTTNFFVREVVYECHALHREITLPFVEDCIKTFNLPKQNYFGGIKESDEILKGNPCFAFLNLKQLHDWFYNPISYEKAIPVLDKEGFYVSLYNTSSRHIVQLTKQCVVKQKHAMKFKEKFSFYEIENKFAKEFKNDF